MKVKAYAAKNEKGLLEPYEYELGEIGPDDVDIEIGRIKDLEGRRNILDEEYNKIKDKPNSIFSNKERDLKEIVEKQKKFEKELDKTHKNLLELSWYMRGGVTIRDLHDMPAQHIKHINSIIKHI